MKTSKEGVYAGGDVDTLDSNSNSYNRLVNQPASNGMNIFLINNYSKK